MLFNLDLVIQLYHKFFMGFLPWVNMLLELFYIK